MTLSRRLTVFFALAVTALVADAQVVIRERVEVDPARLRQETRPAVASVTGDCSGPVLGYAVYHPRSGAVSVGAALAGTVTIKTLCASFSGSISNGFILQRVRPFFWDRDMDEYIYDADPGVELVRVPLRRGDAVVTTTYVAAGDSLTIEGSGTRGLGGIGSCGLGCRANGCDGGGTGVTFGVQLAPYEGLATSLIPTWPAAVTCGSETPLHAVALRGDGTEGYLHPNREIRVKIDGWHPLSQPRGAVSDGTVTEPWLDTTYGALLDSRVSYNAPSCSELTTPTHVMLRAGVSTLDAQRWTTVVPTRTGLDLIVDANGDGQLGDGDADAEFGVGRIGALVPFNDDDDNGEADLLDTGFGDPDLKPLRIEGPIQAGAAVRLEALSGAGAVALWRDPAKRDSVPLPATFSAADLPVTLYAEGATWDAPPLVLRAVYDAGGGGQPAVAADNRPDLLGHADPRDWRRARVGSHVARRRRGPPAGDPRRGRRQEEQPGGSADAARR